MPSSCGRGTRTKKSAVFVSAVQYPPAHPNFSTQATAVYFGFAAGSFGGMGVEITNTGFRLRGGSSYALGTTSPAVNNSGVQYVYLAMV